MLVNLHFLLLFSFLSIIVLMALTLKVHDAAEIHAETPLVEEFFYGSQWISAVWH